MKNIAYFLASLFAIGIATYLFTQYSNTKSLQNPKKNKISGAYEALNFMGDRQTFPSGKIPTNAYLAGWEVKQSMQSYSSEFRDDTEPWETMGPHNKAGRTLSLAFNPQNPNTMYAGSASGGLWRSHTAGVGANAWERVDIDFPVLGVSCITFAPNDSMTMYIGTGEVYNYYEAGTGAAYRRTRGSWGIGILKSTDSGVTWSKSLDWTLNENHGIWAIRIAPNNPNIIYAATTEGVFKSIDAGDTWNNVHNVVMATDLLIHPDDPNKVLVACGNLESPNGGIYRTIDGGSNWTAITNAIPTFRGKIQFGAAPSSPNTVYASIGDGFNTDEGASRLLRSNDFGEHWTLRNTTDYSKWQGWYSHNVAVRPDNPEEIIVLGIEVWKSTDGAATLSKITEGGIGYINPPIEGPDGDTNFVHSDAHDVVYHPTDPNILYIASDGGIHRSLDGGNTFESCNGSYQTMQFYNGFSNSAQDQTFCLGGLQDNGTIRWNGDKTWSLESGGDGSWSAISLDNDNTYYVSYYYLNIYKIITEPESYAYMNIPNVTMPVFIAPFVIAPSNPDVLYAASAGIAKTVDRGITWESINNGNPLHENQPGVLSLAISYSNQNVVYAGTAPRYDTPAKIFKTTNGQSWSDITNNLPNRYPMDIAVDPTDDNTVYVTYAGFGSGHVYKTTNGGDTWTNITGGLPDVPTNAVIVDPLFPANIYIGNDLGVFVSPDGGDTWETYQDGLPNVVLVFDLTISPANRKLRIATHGNGAYQRDLLEEIVDVKDTEWVDNLNITIFPNPTTTDINVKYTLQKQQKIAFSLLDTQGKTVHQIQEFEQSTGEHLVSIPADNLPTGLYYIKTTLNGNQTLKKVVVSK